VDGNWVGTLQGGNLPTRNIAARFIQASPDCVDGSWNTNPPDARWVGAISVFAYPGTLDGFMSFEMPGTGSKQCTGVGNLTGSATDTEANLTWTITSYTPDTCASPPTVVSVKLRRP